MTEVNMTEEKFDFEPATVADALAWMQHQNEIAHTIPITRSCGGFWKCTLIVMTA